MLIFFAFIDDESDRDKFVTLYEKYKKKMFYTAYSVLNDTYSAEDAVHEAFIAIARNIGKINDVNSIETASYVCRAAKNRAINILNSKKREAEYGRPLNDDEDIAFDEPEFERTCAECEISQIAECINKLPTPYREVIVLRYLDDMPPRDIAETLGRKTDTVKKQLLRGRKMLKDMLEGVCG